ncbi:unnamed protein product [Timema podura]|uniref:Ig-like domain-containing protein n=1 Tax=Timema podura TaxID=61482 RepID=A0ABN7NTZ7_TIMPD|nr:unnamed protein product [Timema podura]
MVFVEKLDDLDLKQGHFQQDGAISQKSNESTKLINSSFSLAVQSNSCLKPVRHYSLRGTNVRDSGNSSRNLGGIRMSNAQSNIRVVPTCKDDREELLGALKQETVTLRCEVDANPPLVTFHWTFNNSGDQSEVPPARYTNAGVVSRLNYTPMSDLDYGTLACWGSNAVGHQRAPCIFQVVAAGNFGRPLSLCITVPKLGYSKS